ncbi:MAG: TonB-dependent receptor, partial [Desulfobulbus sp.]|nr:TonB-dependent receptor [Desulfobulbus sp.]
TAISRPITPAPATTTCVVLGSQSIIACPSDIHLTGKTPCIYGYTSATFFNTGEQHNTDISRALDQRLRVNELGEDLGGNLSTGEFGELAYGAGYRLAQASGTTFADQSEEVFSIFASQSLHSADSPWTLAFGLRGNVNTAFDDVLNPELRLIYQKPYWSLTGSYSGSNNIPSFYQRYNHTSSTRPNPDLGMETADNYSLALTLTPMATLSVRTSVFYNRLSDRITYVTGDDGVGQYENFGEVTYRGGDLALNWNPVATLNFKAGYTYLRAIDEETGLFVPAKAEHTATFDCSWQVTDQLTAVFSGKYVSEVYRNRANTKTVPDYMLANLRAEYRLGRYALFTEIKNLADSTYYYADGLLGPPLTWLAGVSWKM